MTDWDKNEMPPSGVIGGVDIIGPVALGQDDKLVEKLEAWATLIDCKDPSEVTACPFDTADSAAALLRAAAALIAQYGVVVPGGYVIVPVEPTEAMYVANKRALTEFINGLPAEVKRRNIKGGIKIDQRTKAVLRYKAMLTAAPKEPK